nr:hypothetical protein [Tanacetum cinerariifolium]
MATIIEQQVALDETLIPSTKRLRIGRSNFKLPSDIQSKESTLQVVYDEFWATATVHHHSIRFKMNNKKHIINLETFRDMLHVRPRIEHKKQKKGIEMYYPRFTKAARTEAEQLKIVLKRSRQETHISQRGGSSTDEGTGSKPGV